MNIGRRIDWCRGPVTSQRKIEPESGVSNLISYFSFLTFLWWVGLGAWPCFLDSHSSTGCAVMIPWIEANSALNPAGGDSAATHPISTDLAG